MVTQIAGIVLALAKALPAILRILDHIEKTRRDANAAELHDTIDSSIARARAATPVCPRPDCPLLRSVLRSPAQPRE